MKTEKLCFTERTLAVRYYDSDTDGTGVVSHYYLQDANYNVTAVTDNAGTVKERYAYTPYGEVTFLDANFANPATSSAISNEYLYTGRRLDPETGLQLNRNRFYHATMGRWVNRDPIISPSREFSLVFSAQINGSEDMSGRNAIVSYGDISLADGLNLYQYVQSKPSNMLDPMGTYAVANCARHKTSCSVILPSYKGGICGAKCNTYAKCCSFQWSELAIKLIMVEVGYPCCVAACAVAAQGAPKGDFDDIYIDIAKNVVGLACYNAAFVPLAAKGSVFCVADTGRL